MEEPRTFTIARYLGNFPLIQSFEGGHFYEVSINWVHFTKVFAFCFTLLTCFNIYFYYENIKQSSLFFFGLQQIEELLVILPFLFVMANHWTNCSPKNILKQKTCVNIIYSFLSLSSWESKILNSKLFRFIYLSPTFGLVLSVVDLCFLRSNIHWEFVIDAFLRTAVKILYNLEIIKIVFYYKIFIEHGKWLENQIKQPTHKFTMLYEEYEKLLKTVHLFEIMNGAAVYLLLIIYAINYQNSIDAIYYSFYDDSWYKICFELTFESWNYLHDLPIFLFSLHYGQIIAGQIDDIRRALIRHSEASGFDSNDQLLIKHRHGTRFKPFLNYFLGLVVSC